MTMPLAWPTAMAVRTLTWKNTRSTATTAGSSSAMQGPDPDLQVGQPLRAAGRPVSVRSTPKATARGVRPTCSTQP